MPITEDLLSAARTDRTARDELIVKLLPILEEYVKKLPRNFPRDDIFQSVLRRILANQDRIPLTESHLLAWVSRIMWNRFFDGRRPPLPIIVDPPDPNGDGEKERLAVLVWTAMQMLPERYRHVLEWTIYDRMSSRKKRRDPFLGL